MNYENLTREQAIAIVGEEFVKSVESENCSFTNRVTSGTDWEGFVEFSASVRLEDDNPLNRECLIAYYYQKSEDVNATEDLGSLNWEIDHFEIC